MSSGQLTQFNIPLKVARVFYAIALIAWGVQHFIFGFFIAGRPMPWPAGLPGEAIIAYTSGALLIVTGGAIIANQKATRPLMAVSIMILLWCGLRDLIFVIINLDYGGNLTNVGKALTIGSAAMLIATTYKSESGDYSSNKKIFVIAPLCQYFTGAFLLISGVQHFLFAEFVKFLMPTWIPGATFWTYFAGVALAAAGLGLITGIKAKLAATMAGWMVFIWLLVLHIPRAVTGQNQNEWTAVFEALAVSGTLFVLSDTIKKK
jgi:uncharacterized membrane protein